MGNVFLLGKKDSSSRLKNMKSFAFLSHLDNMTFNEAINALVMNEASIRNMDSIEKACIVGTLKQKIGKSSIESINDKKGMVKSYMLSVLIEIDFLRHLVLPFLNRLKAGTDLGQKYIFLGSELQAPIERLFQLRDEENTRAITHILMAKSPHSIGLDTNKKKMDMLDKLISIDWIDVAEELIKSIDSMLLKESEYVPIICKWIKRIINVKHKNGLLVYRVIDSIIFKFLEHVRKHHKTPGKILSCTVIHKRYDLGLKLLLINRGENYPLGDVVHMLGYAIYKKKSKITSELFNNREGLQDSFYKLYVMNKEQVIL